MIQTYKEVERLYKTDYQIKKAIADGELFKIERGLYSNEQFANPLEIIGVKYPHAIFTMDSAFYFHGLTDVIPDKMHLAVKRDSTKIKNHNIVQVFVLEKLLDIGRMKIVFDGVTINIYNKERMLIELVRNKKRIPFDYYKEIISSYRRISSDLVVQDIEDYITEFDTEDYIFKTIQEEVF
jgi:predicted transcriptional regulator of viral defense system